MAGYPDIPARVDITGGLATEQRSKRGKVRFLISMPSMSQRQSYQDATNQKHNSMTQMAHLAVSLQLALTTLKR